MQTTLRNLDLNLLLVFDAILTERSISRAATRLHLSQPAVSNALARLRERLSDPLFERSRQGMAPTARARALAQTVREALALLESGVRGGEDFDVANAGREFVVALEDYGEAVILPRFMNWLGSVSPRVRLRIRPEPGSQLQTELREGAVDLTLNYFPIQDADVHNLCILTESLVTLSRHHHPQVRDRLTLDTFLAARHVVLAHDGNARPMIDMALAKRGVARNIAVTVPHFMSMPGLVQHSDLICTMPYRMGLLYAENFRLRWHSVPLRTPQFPIYLSWHRHADQDAGHRWLRERLIEFCRTNPD